MRTLVQSIGFALAMLFASSAGAKIDLVTLPARDTVQVTIYNSADLTLVRESRSLTLRKGANQLQFSWANTLIDPTSLSMVPLAHADQIDVAALVYPPRVTQMGVWTLDSERAGKNPMEITYLTSGLSWRAFYMGTLSPDESSMHLQGYVRVVNNSGEDYENAETRLIVGKVNLLDEIATLAKRTTPYGNPGEIQPVSGGGQNLERHWSYRMPQVVDSLARITSSIGVDVKEVRKEGLSEYFLYTIDGTETIANGWSKRLPSFRVAEVPVLNLYKYDEGQYGTSTIRFLNFKNDEAHKLGDTPIPGGALKVFRQIDAQQHLAYEGQSSFKYIPVEEKVELNLGAVRNVSVAPVLMDYKTQAFMFDNKGNVHGWDEERTWKLELNNTRDIPVKVQVERHVPTAHWAVKSTGADHEKIDLDTIRYAVELAPHTRKIITYVLTTRHGEREHQ